MRSADLCLCIYAKSHASFSLCTRIFERTKPCRLSFDAKEVEGITEINQVLDYMHRNPVSGKWNLVEDHIEYPYSSTEFYEKRIMRDFDVYDFRELVSSESPLDDSEE